MEGVVCLPFSSCLVENSHIQQCIEYQIFRVFTKLGGEVIVKKKKQAFWFLAGFFLLLFFSPKMSGYYVFFITKEVKNASFSLSCGEKKGPCRKAARKHGLGRM